MPCHAMHVAGSPGFPDFLGCSSSKALSRPPLDKLFEIFDGSDAEDKSALLVGDDGKGLGLAAALSAEKGLEVFERGGHGDDGVLCALTAEAGHGGGDFVVGADGAGVEQALEVGDGDVAEEGAGLGRDDGQVGILSLKGGDEGVGDGVGGGEGEGSRGVEVLDCGLWRG